MSTGKGMRAGRLAPVLGVVLLLPLAAHAQPADQNKVIELERRVRELEELVRKLAAERRGETDETPAGAGAVLPGAAPEAAGVAPSPMADPTRAADGGKEKGFAGWDDKDGFIMRSADKRFLLRLTGQIQADYRGFLDGIDYTDVDTFIVRRARLGIEANMFQYYEFRLLPDFSNAQAPGVPGSTRIQDAYVNVHYWDHLQLEAGKFKQPFSYEQLIQDRFVPTLERSLIDQLVPARDEGIMIHGEKLLDDRLDYALAVSNGEINGDFDTEKRKDLAARVAVRPFNCPEVWHCLQGLQFGVAGTIGVEEEPIIPTTLRTPASVLFFAFNAPVRADGLRRRLGPEIAYFNGPLGFAAQYLWEEQRMRPTFSGPGSQFLLDVPFQGGFVLATYLLTGEERTTYSMAIDPLRPFDPCHPCSCPGAWELVVRASRLHIGEEVFAPLPASRTTTISLADSTRYTDGATELTVGFNWYLNRWVRMQVNYERAWFDDPVRLGPGLGGLLQHQDSILTRFQVIF